MFVESKFESSKSSSKLITILVVFMKTANYYYLIVLFQLNFNFYATKRKKLFNF